MNENFTYNKNDYKNSNMNFKNDINSDRQIKLVVVGNSYIGKTSLLYAYTKNQFIANYQTTIFDNYALTLNIDQKKYTINLFDTAGQEDYAHLRVLSYPQTDVFLLCFSLIDNDSFDACHNIWMPEIRKYAGSTVPVLLIGTKEDMIDSPEYSAKRISKKSAQRATAEMGCSKFLACSSLTHRGLKRVFDEAVLTAIETNTTTPFQNEKNCNKGKVYGLKSHENKLFSCCCPI